MEISDAMWVGHRTLGERRRSRCAVAAWEQVVACRMPTHHSDISETALWSELRGSESVVY